MTGGDRTVRDIAGRAGGELIAAHRQGAVRQLRAADREARPGDVVAAVDAAARALGIAPGMTVTRARSLAPGLEVVDAEPEADLAGPHRIALRAGKHYSPVVAPNPSDGIWLDITGCAKLFDNERALLKNLHRRMAVTGVALQIAVADTAGAAHAVARHVPAGRPVTIEPGHHRKAIALLPIAVLRADPVTVEGLRRLRRPVRGWV